MKWCGGGLGSSIEKEDKAGGCSPSAIHPEHTLSLIPNEKSEKSEKRRMGEKQNCVYVVTWNLRNCADFVFVCLFVCIQHSCKPLRWASLSLTNKCKYTTALQLFLKVTAPLL